MALTITIEGKGVIANADALSDSAGGTWTEQGGGTISVSNDTLLTSTESIGGKYASKSGFHQYDIGAGNELDFTTGTGTETGQMLYIWVSMTALGTLDTLANFGLCVRLSSSSPGTTNYIDYLIAGNDDKNDWTGGFKCFVIDPNKTPSRISGTQSSIIASVRTMGIWIDCSTSARADSIFTDQIAVGSGLRITGTSTEGWLDTVTYCNDFATRAWPMLQEREGIYYGYGTMNIGDAASQTAAVSFTDSGKVIQFGESEYYESGAWKTSIAADLSGINIEDHASWTTTFTDGIIVGTDNGRSGSTFKGNSVSDVSMDLYGGNNAASLTALYGTKLEVLTGLLNSGNDVDHKFLGVSFAGCAQFDPVGAPVIRNCTFAETVDTSGAVLWNNNIDIEKCNFIANTTGSGVEHADWNGTESGTVTTADATGIILHDTAGTFLTDVAIGDIVYNETDLSFATVVSIDSNIQITTDGLSGGTDDQFASSDAYSITTPYSYTDLVFSGNTEDVDNTTSPANVVAISKAGTSDPSTYPTGDFVVIQGSVTVQVTVKDVEGTVIENALTGVFTTDDDTEIINADTNVSGIVSTTYAGSTPRDVKVWIRKASSGTPTYYIDTSDSGPTDTNTVWTDDANAFDGTVTTNSSTTTAGDTASNNLAGAGTNAPATGSTITSVQSRVSGSAIGTNVSLKAAVYQSDDTLLGTPSTDSTSGSFGDYVTLTVPSGGWDWTKVQGLKTEIYADEPAGTPVTYYFDGSDAAASDPNAVWTDETNTDDGSTSTYANTTTVGTTASNYIIIEGTDAPSTGSSITQVRARIYGTWEDIGGTGTVSATIFTDALAENLGTATITARNTFTPVWSNYTTLSAPSGGWTWAKLQALETKTFMDTGGIGPSGRVYKIELEVTPSGGSLTSATAEKVEIKVNTDDIVKYINYSSVQTISSSGLTLAVTMVEDTNNNSTT